MPITTDDSADLLAQAAAQLREAAGLLVADVDRLVDASLLLLDAADGLSQAGALIPVGDPREKRLDELADRAASLRAAWYDLARTGSVRTAALRALGCPGDTTPVLWQVDATPTGELAVLLVTAFGLHEDRYRTSWTVALHLPAWAVDAMLDRRLLHLLHPWDSGIVVPVPDPVIAETAMALLERDPSAPLGSISAAVAAATALVAGD